MMGWLRDKAQLLKKEVGVLWLAVRDPRTPRTAKWLAGLVVAYALSPIDLIPDFLPVLGLLDDLLLLPLGIYCAIRLIPKPLMEELRIKAEQDAKKLPQSRQAAIAIVAFWCVTAALAGIYVMRIYGSSSISQ